MFYSAKKHTAVVDGLKTDYVAFGKGTKPLIIIPGLGFTRVKSSKYSLAMAYRRFSCDYRVYIIDRREDMPDGYSVDDMADDTARVIKHLGLLNCHIIGISQGGMIAQRIAEKFPELVERLVLCVTLSRQNEVIRDVIGTWMELCRSRKYLAIARDTIDKIYSDSYARSRRWTAPFFALVIRFQDHRRFMIMAEACLTFEHYDELELIRCPVMVLGGREDRVVTSAASVDIAEKLGCPIHMYDGIGHSPHHEAKRDFDGRVYDFLTKDVFVGEQVAFKDK